MSGVAKIITKPKRTVFDINPKTGLPYLTVEYATALIHRHIHSYVPYLKMGNEMDDLVQMFLLRLCHSKFNPKKSAAVTWAVINLNSGAQSIAKSMFAAKRTGSDKIDVKGKKVKILGNVSRVPAVIYQETFTTNSNDELMSTLDIRPETVTPEDVLLAKEIVELNPETYSDYAFDRPVRFNPAHRFVPGVNDKHRCCTCHQWKNSLRLFGSNRSLKNGRAAMCKKCHSKLMKKDRARNRERERETARIRYAANPEKYKTHSKDAYRKKKLAQHL